jgi:hypothetical protein
MLYNKYLETIAYGVTPDLYSLVGSTWQKTYNFKTYLWDKFSNNGLRL